jgi:hypothetical protein
MRNHFHLIIETPRANLVAGMKWLLATYAARFNRRHRYRSARGSIKPLAEWNSFPTMILSETQRIAAYFDRQGRRISV